MRPTALGVYIGVVLDISGGGSAYYTVAFDKKGNWKSACWHATRKQASEHRAYLRRLHKRLAKEYAARKRNRPTETPPPPRPVGKG
jgi:hypothetical protein